MSLKNTPTLCFVIDASIARAAGSLESVHPTGVRCREFLQKIRGICHRMAWNESIKAEWAEHESTFTRTWRLSMFNLGKLRPIEDSESESLRATIQAHAENEGAAEAMLKDVHLIEAAVATDKRVAALDKVRGHFARLKSHFDGLADIHWVDPAKDDNCTEWLEAGAPDDANFALSPPT